MKQKINVLKYKKKYRNLNHEQFFHLAHKTIHYFSERCKINILLLTLSAR